MTVIEMDGVTKRFGDVTALRGLDLTVEAGEVVGLVGPNGSGKSTTLDVLLGYVRPTSGTVRAFGRDVRTDAAAIRRRVGAVPDAYAVYDGLSGRRHVEFVAALREVDTDPERVLDRVGLADAADQPAGTYSKGMTQRLVLGAVLVGSPDLLVFDEPLSGIDPGGVSTVESILREEADRGAAVVLSSHRTDRLATVCDRLAVLDGGELAAVRDGAAASNGPAELRLAVDDVPESVLSALRDRDGVDAVSRDGDRLRVVCDPTSRFEALSVLDAAGVPVDGFETADGSLSGAYESALSEGER